MAFPYLKDLLYWLLGVEVPLTQFIPTFGLCVALALLMGLFLYTLELKRVEKELGIQFPGGASEFAQNLTMFSLLAGMFGAKVFFLLEYPEDFIQNPIGMFFSRGGWTIFGGIFFGLSAGIYYVKKKRLPVKNALDAVAPIIFFGYGIGRIGCHLSGDGDWGIPSNLDLRPSWFPEWFWSHSYTNNILGVTLEVPVYPTPLYECLGSLFCFLILWSLRNHKFQTGWLFSLYLVLAGLERFLIEQIRVNEVYNLGFAKATQAEIISLILIPVGLFGLMKFMKKKEFLKRLIYHLKI